jgi:caffeoyl-CoA O-methyltransferase
MTSDKFTEITPELYRYAVAHSSFRDGPGVSEVEQAGSEMGSLAQMQIGGDQAALISILVAATGTRRAIEVGTFLGYGALSIARGLPPDGELVVCELDPAYAERARGHLEIAGLAERVEFVIGPATETLPAIADDAAFDFAFVDADKPNYLTYYEECVRLLRPGGLLMLDNVFMSGRVLEPSEEGPEAIAELNERVAADDRVESAVLGIADGVTLARKR